MIDKKDPLYNQKMSIALELNRLEKEVSNKDKEPLVALGDSIKDLAKADLAVFLNDWNQYRGCIIEHHTAKIYEIPHISIKSENGLLKVVEK